MKKLFLVFLLLLSGCQTKPQYYLYVYYAQTCPHCRSFIQVVIPEFGRTIWLTDENHNTGYR